MSNKELESKIYELRELQNLIEEAEAEIEVIKDKIKAHMGASEEMRCGKHKVTWKTVLTSRLDTAALKKELPPDTLSAFTKVIPYRRFYVS